MVPLHLNIFVRVLHQQPVDIFAVERVAPVAGGILGASYAVTCIGSLEVVSHYGHPEYLT